MGAGDECVQLFDLVGKPVIDKKVERTVRDRRLGAETRIAQSIEHFVGADGAMFLKQDLQGLAPYRRKAQAFLGASFFSGFYRRMHTTAVIMGFETHGFACGG